MTAIARVLTGHDTPPLDPRDVELWAAQILADDGTAILREARS